MIRNSVIFRDNRHTAMELERRSVQT